MAFLILPGGKIFSFGNGLPRRRKFTERLHRLNLLLNTKIMSVSKRINPIPKLNNDTGFSTIGNINGGRFINRDGSFNLRKTGWPIMDRISVYYAMLMLPLSKFIALIFIFFIFINLLFTGIYMWLGIDQFTGLIAKSGWE